ncbi:protoglobin domain-containing protein [Paenibacillus qinlingensis]|uniref:Globin-sensor domain-containing protein n=1 Tax=Paenibacillus qinlingensis TaxID=1837343 RepID=A0ABU1NTS8_9BACL|nr:protoglobin domain-containing protein [Paenibacillus qinlingensis]MDR6550893.1 hypothetical protein [Paenibacillus qinlingensis]
MTQNKPPIKKRQLFIPFLKRFAGDKYRKFDESWRSGHQSTVPATIEMKDPVILKQLEMIDLTLDEVRCIQSVQPLVRLYIEDIVDGFYQTITGVESLQAIITSNSTVERLRQTLKSHLIEMFSGRIDEEYLQKRMRVADVHSRIGLEPKWYMGAFQNLQNTLMLLVNRNVEDRDESLRISKAITKILNFEQQIVLEAYEKENVRQRELQYEQVKEELKRKVTTVSEEIAAVSEQTNTSVQNLIAAADEVNVSVERSAGASRETQSLATEGQTS